MGSTSQEISGVGSCDGRKAVQRRQIKGENNEETLEGDALFSVGEKVECRWMERSYDGKYHFYPATVEVVHGDGAEYTVRWMNPDGYDPTLRASAKYVRALVQSIHVGSKPKSRKKAFRPRLTLVEKLFLSSSADPDFDEAKDEKTSSKGRRISCVKRFSASSVEDDALQRTLLASARMAKTAGRPPEWEGDVLREMSGRKFYGAVRLDRPNESLCVRIGDCVMLRPTKAQGWESGLPWVAIVRELYQDIMGEMMFSCVWFYRPHDCSPKVLQRDTLPQQEVFLTDETDENIVRSIIKKCSVVGEREFMEHAARCASDRAGSARRSSAGFEDGEDAEETLLCKFRYDVREMKMSPILNTADVLHSAAFGLLVEKKIFAHIRDFQIKWIACLHRYGHYKENTEECQEEGRAVRNLPKENRKKEANRNWDGAVEVKSKVGADRESSYSSSLTAPMLAQIVCVSPERTCQRSLKMNACAYRASSSGIISASPSPLSSRSSMGSLTESARALVDTAKALYNRGREASSPVQPTKQDLDQYSSSPCSTMSLDDDEGSLSGKKRARTQGAFSVSSKKLKTDKKKNSKFVSKSLEFVHGEFVEAKWDDGLYYPAFIVKRLVRGQKNNFKECIVEWADPEGYPGYWEDSGYPRTQEIPISNIRSARCEPPSQNPGISSATMKAHCEEDWEKAAEKAVVEQRVADAGLEWHPTLSQADVRSLPGFDKLWVCTARHCGKAFTGLHFLRAHQLSNQHGRWKDLVPLGCGTKETVAEVDCTRSGDVEFVSQSVEKNCRSLVRQSKSSEEPRICNNLVPGKVLHTGESGRGFALFATRNIKAEEFLGHYSGTIKDIGYKKQFSGHYTFGLLHCWAMDGTTGGAWRFMNHCLEKDIPSVRALIVNHFGVPHIALYANRDVREGEELLLRYKNVSDAEFFGFQCGQD